MKSKIWIPNDTYWINDNGTVSYECTSCNNVYTEEEGFSLATCQCYSCDLYDVEEPIRKAERNRLKKWWEDEGRYIEANIKLKY